MHFKRMIVIGVVFLDLGLLTTATVWLFPRGGQATGSISANAAPPSATTATAKPGTATTRPVLPASRVGVAVSKTARAVTGGPKFVICGMADKRGDVWIGSEGDGVWRLVGNTWQQFTTKDGVASDDIQSIACDGFGRIWVGHTASGVSVFDGAKWGRYGLLDGVGGSHVSAIAASPIDGSVWLATETGLTRFSPAGGTWTNYARGLDAPDGVANGLSFDTSGTLYAAIDDGGVATASAADGYKTWRTVAGPETMPITETGSGLPGPLTNAVLATPDGRVFAGSTRGLSRSDDQGRTWAYLRGKSWPGLAAGRYDGVPTDFRPKVTTPLTNDWVTALATVGDGGLWVGFRSGGYQYFPNPTGPAAVTGKGLVRAIVASPNGRCMIGTYGSGVVEHDTTPLATQRGGPKPPVAAGLPPRPQPPTEAELAAWTQRLAALPAAPAGVDVLPDDWETTGAWCGRYGSITAQLLGMHMILGAPEYDVANTTGPFRRAAGRRYWAKPKPADKYINSGLLYPDRGYRVYCEYNDESYDTTKHPVSVEGPDMYYRFRVPAGVHRVSLYFQNNDGRARWATERDYEISVKQYDPAGPRAADAAPEDDEAAYYDSAARPNRPRLIAVDTIEPELSPTIAHTRVPHFVPGVYKRFVVRGPGVYWFKIGRNHSQTTKMQGIFIDPLDRPIVYVPEYPHPPADPGRANPAAAALWAAADAAVSRKDYARVGPLARLAAYRYAAANGASPDLLVRWRWSMGAWTADDAKQFAAWEAALPKSWGDDQ